MIFYNENGEQDAKISALYDLADILATAEYDANETEPEPSFVNPNDKPKNAAHKGVKYWYKFRNELYLTVCRLQLRLTYATRARNSLNI